MLSGGGGVSQQPVQKIEGTCLTDMQPNESHSSFTDSNKEGSAIFRLSHCGARRFLFGLSTG
jgi:hypothetical protein